MDKKARIKQFILEEIVDESSPGTTDFDDDEVLTDSGILDSLGMLKLVAFLDEEMQTDIMSQPFSIDNFRTLDMICTLVDASSSGTSHQPVQQDVKPDAEPAGRSETRSEIADVDLQRVASSGLDPGLAGKVALITGSSRGVGAMIARVLAIYGCKVVVNFNSNETKAMEVVRDIEDEGGDAIAVRADVSDPGQVVGMFQRVADAYGNVDILVNNAVRDYDAISFADLEWPDIQDAMNVVVRGAFNCCKAAIPGMRKSGGGKIVNIGTLATEAPAPNQLKYVMSKSALVGLTRSIAVDFAADNIQANLVCPSLIETDLVAHIPKSFRKKVASDTPMQRNATTNDVAQAVVFLASNHSSFVTGQRIMVTGGLTPFL